MSDTLRERALAYHQLPTPGKIGIEITKPSATQADLVLAYTPGVAAPVREIAKDPDAAYRYTAKGNLVAVISNGTAILGLGDKGPLASKPVMEGKAVLFKKFAGVDVFDIEVDAADPRDLIETVARIAPTFGGINLEDIKAPECFDIEAELIERLDIPVFHDDQHGTAIIIGAALENALRLNGKKIEEIRIVCVGAGAAGIASMRLLKAMGVPAAHIMMCDRNGVVHTGRSDLNRFKAEFAVDTDRRTLHDALTDADVFIGLSGPDVMSADMLRVMARDPLVFALSNPDPEINPKVAHATRDDVIMATGRSDYPNQVNNVLGFPYIFRGALDVRARRINEEMKIAAVRALRDLTHVEVPRAVLEAYRVDRIAFGREYLVPKPLDPRLIEWVPPAVARAAVETGVARLGYPAHYPPMSEV
ncbi:MAG: malate dehydrogenase [Gammaproteobacteria bacterium]|nr:malate dehydrogenase [Gammaproteobacteria bacterium]